MVTRTWTGGSGSFLNGGSWSTGGMVGTAPQPGDNATISAPGAYTVTVNPVDVITNLGSLLINAPSATVDVEGTVSAGIQLSSGTLLLNNRGEIDIQGSQNFTGGTIIVPSGTTGFGFIYGSSTLAFGTNLQMYVQGYSLIFGNYLTLQFFNSANIQVSGTSGYLDILYDTFVNSGVINVGSADVLNIRSTDYQERGQIHVAGGGRLTFTDANSLPTFSAAGTITLDPGAFVQGTLGASFTAISTRLSAPNWRVATGAVIDLQGPINNTGFSTTLGSGSGIFGTTIIEGTVTGGTIIGGAGLSLKGRLSQVTALGTINGSFTDDHSVFLASDGTSRGTLGIPGSAFSLALTNGTVLDNVYYGQSGGSGQFGASEDMFRTGGVSGTFGARTTLELGGTSGQIYFGAGSLTNLGTLLGHVSGGYISVSLDSYTNASSGLISISNGQNFYESSSFANLGTIGVASGAQFIASSTGIKLIQSGQFGLDNATATFAGTISGTGTFSIADGGILTASKGFDPLGIPSLVFGAGTDNVLAYGSAASFTPTVANFGSNDEIDLLNFDASTFVASASAITIGSGANVATIAFATPFATTPGFSVRDVAALHTTILTTTACYAAGTRILTDAGERPIEALRAGDRVATVIGRGGMAAVRWIGWRTIDIARHPRPAAARPVRVRAGAIAANVPHRDLILSPEHAILLDGALVPIRCLIDGEAIAVMDVPTVTYVHLELARHDVILAEGLAAETWLDTGNRAIFANAAAPMLHPDFTPDPVGFAAAACRPVVTDGARVAEMRKRLAGRRRLPRRQTG